MPERPGCCVCPPRCPGTTTATTPPDADPDLAIAACVEATCAVCLHGCPRVGACCMPSTPTALYPPEIANVLQLLDDGGGPSRDEIAQLRAELDYLIQSRRGGIGPDGQHRYISTACAHGRHDQCRLRCKYCGTECACPGCTHPTSDPGSILDQLAAVTAERDRWRARAEQAEDRHDGDAWQAITTERDRLAAALAELRATASGT
jgi:hypothetical protein